MRKLNMLVLGALLTGCGTIGAPTYSAQTLVSAPTEAVLDGITITLSGGAANDDMPRGGYPTIRTTGLDVTLTGNSTVLTKSTVEGLYVVSGDNVYKATATQWVVLSEGQVRYSGKLSMRLKSGTQVTVVTLVTAGKTAQLLRDSKLVTVASIN